MPSTTPQLVTILLFCTAFVCFFGALCCAGILYINARKKQQQQKEKIIEENFREELLEAVHDMQDNTFRSISREIHDNVGQLLSLAKLNVNTLALEQSDNSRLLAIKDLISKAITALRNIGVSYHSDHVLELGLLAGIHYQVTQLSNTGLFGISYSCDIEDLVTSRSDSVVLYRIVQETINNIIRHSDATQIAVAVSAEKNTACISITDNGKSFDPADPGFRPGIGLDSMQQRANMIGAKLTVETDLKKGTIVRIFFATRS